MASSYESLTVGASAVGFTSTLIAPTGGERYDEAVCVLEDGQIRVRTDGTDPTTSEGMLVEVGQRIVVSGYDDLKNFRAIRTGSTNGTLKCTYSYKEKVKT